jgi:hypothetical protein
MQIRKLKFYSVWGRFWNWIIRIILIAIIIALLFNFNLNPKGFIVGIIIALLLIVYINDDLIEIEDNGIFLSRNYFFGLLIKKKFIQFESIKDIQPGQKGNCLAEDWLFIGLQSRLVITTWNNEITIYKTLIVNSKLHEVSNIVIKRINNKSSSQ